MVRKRNWGATIRRLLKGTTIRKLSYALGVSDVTIWYWSHDRYEPSEKHQKKILSYEEKLQTK